MQEKLDALVRTQAMQLFRQQGLHFTMQQVAEPLHISKKSFEKLDTLIGNVFIGITRVLHNNTEFFSCTVSCDFQKITKQAIF